MTIRDSAGIFLQILTPQTATGLPLELDVYSYTDYATKLDTFPAAFEVSFLKAQNEEGSGTFKIMRADPKATDANLHQDNLVKVKLNGVEVFAFFLEEFNRVTASPDEGGGEAIQITGRGILSYLGRAVVYPDNWPTSVASDVAISGQGKAKTLLDQIRLAQARTPGAIPLLTYDFSNTLDSLSDPWTDDLEDSLKIGTDLLSLAKKFTGYGDFNVYTDPNFVFHAYKAQGVDRTQSVVLSKGRHIGLEDVAKHTHNIGLATRLLVLGQGGAIVEVSDSSLEAQPGIGRREGFLSYSTTADTQSLQDAGTATLAALQLDSEPLQLTVNHGIGGGLYEPFVDYNIGDIISIDSLPDWDHAPFQIVGITISQIEGGDFKVILDLNSYYLDPLSALAANVSNPGSGGTTFTPGPGGGGSNTTGSGLVSPAAGDAAGYLSAKLVAGAGIALALVGTVPNEQLQISAAGDAGWTALAYGASWSDNGAPYMAGAYRKDALGFVHLRGVAKAGAAAAAAIAQLPAGYRPAGTALFASSVAAAFGTVTVDGTGHLTPSTNANGTLVSLDGISFLGEA